jgi:hypothetical protein
MVEIKRDQIWTPEGGDIERALLTIKERINQIGLHDILRVVEWSAKKRQRSQFNDKDKVGAAILTFNRMVYGGYNNQNFPGVAVLDSVKVAVNQAKKEGHGRKFIECIAIAQHSSQRPDFSFAKVVELNCNDALILFTNEVQKVVAISTLSIVLPEP